VTCTPSIAQDQVKIFNSEKALKSMAREGLGKGWEDEYGTNNEYTCM
jgi:hypothetical protein